MIHVHSVSIQAKKVDGSDLNIQAYRNEEGMFVRISDYTWNGSTMTIDGHVLDVMLCAVRLMVPNFGDQGR